MTEADAAMVTRLARHAARRWAGHPWHADAVAEGVLAGVAHWPEEPESTTRLYNAIRRRIGHYMLANKRRDARHARLAARREHEPDRYAVMDLRAAMASLPAGQADLLHRSYWLGQGCEEIGRETGRTEDAVKAARCRLMGKLRRILCVA